MPEFRSCLVLLEAEHAQQRKQAFMRSLPWLGAALILTLCSFYVNEVTVLAESAIYSVTAVLFVAAAILWLFTLKNLKCLAALRHVWAEYGAANENLGQLDNLTSTKAVRGLVADLQHKAQTNRLIKALLDVSRSNLDTRLLHLRQQELQAELNKEVTDFQKNAERQIEKIKQDLPLFKAQSAVQASIVFLQARREELKVQWELAYANFSWWNKIKYSGGPDFSELDRVLNDLNSMNQRMAIRHEYDFKVLERHFCFLKSTAIKRVVEAKGRADRFILEQAGTQGIESDLLKKALLFSAMSIPVSAWSDLDHAGSIFDALRGVNGNFAGMSDAEVWWETLFLPTESLAGLAALTKGAYFEQLVAADTGGALFEHFNHPGTDIVIDDTAFQLKATDSESYVNSVADGIPVIATSEVAEYTGSVDSGYTNEELTHAVDLALGGTVVDLGDSTVDAILAGVGGLGFFATLQGINHAVKKHENGGDPAEAAFEGAGVAIEGTARAFVGAAEMSYKVLASRPSRFMGRMLLKGLVKLDEKYMTNTERK